MRILLKKISNGKDYDISNLLTTYSWSGSIEQGVRSFSFDILNNPYDEALSSMIPVIATGDIVSFYTDSDYIIPNYLLFYGKVYDIGKKSQKGTVTYNCLDFLNNLARSETNRIYKDTAENIANSICGEFGLPVQFIAPTGVSIGTMVFEDKTYFEIIKECFEKAGLSTGKDYVISMDGDKFYVQEYGYPLLSIMLSDGSDNDEDKKNIISSSFEESMNNLINRVNVYDSDGKLVTKIDDSESISKYGLFEKNYTVEKDVDVTTGATKQLHGIDTIIKFEVLGEVNYWSGRSVMVHDKATGLDGQFLITNDNHIWTPKSYTTTLNLKYMGLVG